MVCEYEPFLVDNISVAIDIIVLHRWLGLAQFGLLHGILWRLLDVHHFQNGVLYLNVALNLFKIFSIRYLTFSK
jgi:hypothetical protein